MDLVSRQDFMYIYLHILIEGKPGLYHIVIGNVLKDINLIKILLKLIHIPNYSALNEELHLAGVTRSSCKCQT